MRGPRQKAEQSLSEITAECEALKSVLQVGTSGDWTTLIESIEVQPGYENALAAALGDDLGAALDDNAPVYWSSVNGTPSETSAAALPSGVAPLSRFVKAPPQLAKRLNAIGVVAPELGARLQNTLPNGVRLVSQLSLIHI